MRPSTTLAMHENSHGIKKLKPPKIKVVHVFEPEIMKTDAANFRELVQRLTGKPTTAVILDGKKKDIKKKIHGESVPRCHEMMVVEKYLACREEVVKLQKEEERSIRWVENDSGTGFLREFEEIDDFIQELSDSPLSPSSSSSPIMDVNDKASASKQEQTLYRFEA